MSGYGGTSCFGCIYCGRYVCVCVPDEDDEDEDIDGPRCDSWPECGCDPPGSGCSPEPQSGDVK